MFFRTFLFAAVISAAVAEDLPPSCEKRVYCNSSVLHHVQMARIYTDSKKFVDLQLRYDEDTIINDFDQLLAEKNNTPSREDIEAFVGKYFDNSSELEYWEPTDYSSDPNFVKLIRDETLKKYGKDINDIWPTLGRKVKQIVVDKPEMFSLIPVTHGFIIPGGRFTELYYWDTYWIVEGLLVSDMHETAKGVIENLIQLLKKIGHIPNGSRWYYQERSQPPLLTAMVSLYYRYTKDKEFLKQNIAYLEKEMYYFIDNQIITFEKDDRDYTMLRYFAPSAGPRPESYYEDYTNAQAFPTEERKSDFYTDIKSAAESGWDFSSRWFIDNNGKDTGNLTNIHTGELIPVDLNAIFANALQNIAYFRAILRQPNKAAHWAYLAKQWRSNIEKVLWNEEDGVWYDYDFERNAYRKYFYPSNLAPLWMNAVESKLLKKHGPRVLNYLRTTGSLEFPGGVPTSLNPSGEQWDFPNAWPPLISIVVNSLEVIGTPEAKELAFDTAQTWIRACLKGFQDSKVMFEKYNVENPGETGDGGEYTGQTGFGWSNGVVLEFLAKYGERMTAHESLLGKDSNLVHDSQGV